MTGTCAGSGHRSSGVPRASRPGRRSSVRGAPSRSSAGGASWSRTCAFARRWMAVTAGSRSADACARSGLPCRTASRSRSTGPPAGTRRPWTSTTADGSQRFAGEMRIPDVATWWPHTHGTPALHSVVLRVVSGASTLTLDAGRVGFRSLAAGPSPDHDVARDGLDLHVNGVSVFARGAVWTPVDPIGVAVPEAELRASLELVVAGGMNMLRVPGIGLYESDAFHELCDELGILVWQDLMFANLDYPFVDDAFRGLAEREAVQVVGRLAGRPSTAVLCGNSEVEQQVAMLGLDPVLGRDPFYAETLPAIAADAGSDAVVVPSTPFGGDLPFRPDRGIANYYGVGGYRRPLSDARMAGVRFAGECLAFSNLPDGATVDQAGPDGIGGRAPRQRRRLGLRGRPRSLSRGAARRRPGSAPARRSRAVPGAVTGRDRRGHGRGIRGVAPRGVDLRRRPRPVVAGCRPGRRLGSARPGWTAQDGLPSPPPYPRSDRGLDDGRRAWGHRRPRRQRPAGAAVGAAAHRALSGRSSSRSAT